MKPVSKRGFASLDPKLQKEIARKGGNSVSQDRAHMSEIGRRGGKASYLKRVDSQVLQ